jgi:5-methylcytosine-specific restriction endonuclease McrA
VCKEAKRIEDQREARHRRRARERGAFIAPVSPRQIHERDGWRCHICRKKVSKTAVVPHPRAATLDHLVPLAALGSHEPANVATACFRCNCIKGDRGGGEQLMLVG